MEHSSRSARTGSKRHLKSFLFVFLFLWALTGLASCGAPADGKIHLTLWYWNRSIDDKLIAQVSQQFPNIVIDNVKVDGYKNKLLTAMAGHKGVPDIFA